MLTQVSVKTAIPKDTAHLANAAFGRNNPYMRVGDQLTQIMHGEDDLSNGNGPVDLLSLVTAFQFNEGLSDSQAVEAIRTRIDWKYALHLPMNFPQVGHTRLCEERQRVLHDPAHQKSFQDLLVRLKGIRFFDYDDLQEDYTIFIIETVCTLSRMEIIIKTMCQAIETLAADHPEWLRQIVMPGWFTRYGPDGIKWRLPVSTADQEALTLSIGKDTRRLIEALPKLETSDLNCLTEIQSLKRIWQQQFSQAEDGSIQYLPRCSYCGDHF